VVRLYPEGPPSGSLEARASLALKGLAIIYVVGAVFALVPGPTPTPNLLAVTFNLAAVSVAVLYLVIARAIDRGSPWAVAAIRLTLLLVAVAGLSWIAVALSEGTQRVPYDILVAVWAWRGEPYVRPSPRPDRRDVLSIGGAVALTVTMLLAKPLTGWGGLADVHEPDLDGVIDADCRPPAAGPPASVAISLDWSWRSTTVLPSGADIVVVGWTGANAEGRPLFVIGDIPQPGAGIHTGLEGYPSETMAREAASESPGSFRWTIVLNEQRLRPGHIDLQLMRTSAAAPDHGSETITATYVHVGVWRHEVAKVICSW
jgi:hypothetical protein